SSSETNIANAPVSQPNSQGLVEMSPVKASAYFLEPRFLLLEQQRADDSKVSAVAAENANDRSELVLTSHAVALGTSPRVKLRLQRTDALPTRAQLELFTLKAGKEQWFNCELESSGDEQYLELTFYTANREPGKTHSI